MLRGYYSLNRIRWKRSLEALFASSGLVWRWLIISERITLLGMVKIHPYREIVCAQCVQDKCATCAQNCVCLHSLLCSAELPDFKHSNLPGACRIGSQKYLVFAYSQGWNLVALVFKDFSAALFFILFIYI